MQVEFDDEIFGGVRPDSANPRYRLAEIILAESQRAGLGPGSQLPTERQLAADLGATRTSVRHALAILEAEGLISREIGRGTFLREAPLAARRGGSAVLADGGWGRAGDPGTADPGAGSAGLPGAGSGAARRGRRGAGPAGHSSARPGTAGAGAGLPGAGSGAARRGRRGAGPAGHSSARPGAAGAGGAGHAGAGGYAAPTRGASDDEGGYAAPTGSASADEGGTAGFAPADVMAIRRLLEPPAMKLVVAWATPADFAEINRCLVGGERAASYDEFEVWDLALHRTILAASHSPLLTRLYSLIEEARHTRFWGDIKRRSASRERQAQYQADHQELVAALRSRDADRATEAMRAHLARVASHLFGEES